MGMRGMPGMGKDIFKQMKEVKGEDPNNISSPVLEGGAAASLKRKMTPKADVSIVEKALVRNGLASLDRGIEVEHNTPKTKVKVSIIEDAMLGDILEACSEHGNNDMAVKVLFGLYMKGNLEGYEIEGIDKKEILSILEDFKMVLNRVIV